MCRAYIKKCPWSCNGTVGTGPLCRVAGSVKFGRALRYRMDRQFHVRYRYIGRRRADTATTHVCRIARRGRRRLSHSLFLVLCARWTMRGPRKRYIFRVDHTDVQGQTQENMHGDTRRTIVRLHNEQQQWFTSRHKSQSVDSRGGTLRQDLNHIVAETRIVKISRLLPIFGLAVDTSGDAYDPRRHFVPGHHERNESGKTANENPPISEDAHVQTLADDIIKSSMLGES